MRENTNWNNKIEYVEKTFEEWENIYEIPVEKEFLVKAFLNLQWDYQNIPENHYKAKTDILNAINLLSNSLNLEKNDKEKFVDWLADLKDKTILLEKHINTIVKILGFSLNDIIINIPIITKISHSLDKNGLASICVEWDYNQNNIDWFMIEINTYSNNISNFYANIKVDGNVHIMIGGNTKIVSKTGRYYVYEGLSCDNVYTFNIRAHKKIKILDKEIMLNSDIITSAPYYPKDNPVFMGDITGTVNLK
jgi:hypothetical protein